ncbi:MAG TPA: glycosyltransferase [Ferruginibacter sp.]|nr:glycosyltransferase [Ferruginibacter sp.]
MYLIDYYGNPYAGTEGQLLQLIQYLDRTRYEPTMAVLRDSEYIQKNMFPCPVSVLSISNLASINSVKKFVCFALKLRRQGYKLIHCYFNDSSLIAPFFMWLLGIHVIVSRRDMGFWYTFYNLAILRFLSIFVDCYVTNSQAVKYLISQREWIPQRKITVIYNGYIPLNEKSQIDTSIELLKLPSDAPIVGIVANLRAIKRLDTLLEAFALVNKHRPDAYLVIVGDKNSVEATKILAKLTSLIHRLGIGERVIFTGRVEDPKLYIRQFTVSVLCSDSEGFSNSIIEYMQAGCPTVCTNTGGNSELIKDGFNGFLVPVGDFNTLAKRVIQLLSDKILACQLGEAGYETVIKFTHVRMIKEQMDCYDKLLSHRRWDCRFAR